MSFALSLRTGGNALSTAWLIYALANGSIENVTHPQLGVAICIEMQKKIYLSGNVFGPNVDVHQHSQELYSSTFSL